MIGNIMLTRASVAYPGRHDVLDRRTRSHLYSASLLQRRKGVGSHMAALAVVVGEPKDPTL